MATLLEYRQEPDYKVVVQGCTSESFKNMSFLEIYMPKRQKNKQVGLNQIKELLYSKGNKQQSENASYGMG